MKQKIEYIYNGKRKRFYLIESERQITTICEAVENEAGDEIDIEVVSPGMSYNELVEMFPPDKNSKRAGMDFCLVDMIRAIVWEAYRDLGESYEGGNVRHFWYTHLKYVVEDILKLGETESVKGAINTAWGNLIDSGLITYEGMNIVSAKENVRKSYISDSPFRNLLIAVEKENLFEEFQWIPELFNCTLITAGGQPSRSVSRSFARQLVQEMKDSGTDISKDIYMCTISDLDPAGFYIQEAFRNQIEKALEYYGSNANVQIRRLFVRPEQVTPNLLQHKAMKCEDIKAKNESAKKSEDTKWAYFCEQTKTAQNPDGGLYKIENEKQYRAKLELDAFPINIVERNILNELLKIIRATSDESLIMIPEIMRIFNGVSNEVIEEIYKRHKDDWLTPIIETYLSIADEVMWWFDDITRQEKQNEYNRYNDIVEPIKEKYEIERNESEYEATEIEETQQKLIDEYKTEQGHDIRLDEIEEAIRKLELERDDIEEDIQENCKEQFDTISEAWEYHEENVEYINEEETNEIKPFKSEHEKTMDEINLRKEYRTEKVEELKRWHEANFNSVDIELQNIIKNTLSEFTQFRYRQIESDVRSKVHIAKLMTNPKLLLKDNISAWEQINYPIFTEIDCLEKAATKKEVSIESQRRGFTTDFIDSLKVILHENCDDVEIDYPDPPEIDETNFRNDLEQLKEEVEQDIKDGKHKKIEEMDE